jgi:hypothetical protein
MELGGWLRSLGLERYERPSASVDHEDKGMMGVIEVVS